MRRCATATQQALTRRPRAAATVVRDCRASDATAAAQSRCGGSISSLNRDSESS